MDSDSSRGPMERFTKADMSMMRNRVKEDSTTVTGHITKENGSKVDSMEGVNSRAGTERFTKAGMSTAN